MTRSAEELKGNLPPVVLLFTVGLKDLHQDLNLLVLPVTGGLSGRLDQGQELEFNKIERFESKQKADLLNLLVRLSK
jgi:hypothetical protein